MLKIRGFVVAAAVVALVGVVVPSAASAAAKAKLPPIGHVFVINLENKSYDETWGPSSPAPYLSQTLVGQGVQLSQYFGIGHVSLDNYVAEISGQGPSKQTQLDCFTYADFVSTGTGDFGQALGDGCVYPTTVQTIADQLTAKGLTWKGYMEDMSTPCKHPELGAKDTDVVATATGAYATRHNPFIYFHSIVDAPICQKNVVALDALDHRLASIKTTPNLSFITPNLCNDAHDSPCPTVSRADWPPRDDVAPTWVPKILASPAYKKDGLLIVTFDEAEAVGSSADATACCDAPTYPNVTQREHDHAGSGRRPHRRGAPLPLHQAGVDERHALQPLRPALQPGETSSG